MGAGARLGVWVLPRLDEDAAASHLGKRIWGAFGGSTDLIYNIYAELLHLPKDMISAVVLPICAARLAAPILRECEVSSLVLKPAVAQQRRSWEA